MQADKRRFYIYQKPYAAGTLYHHEALNGTGYPHGVTIDAIPLEGQIIRVADEYDAIVNKRQYKSHIGISDTLKILIENATPVPAKPEENLDKKMTKLRKKYGKINKKILIQLFKIVIDDIEYEITCVKEYVDYLISMIDSLPTVDKITLDNETVEKLKESLKKAYKAHLTLEKLKKQIEEKLPLLQKELDDLKSNALKAESKYKNKYVEITGEPSYGETLAEEKARLAKEKKEAEELLAERRAKKVVEEMDKFEITFTGSSVESITQIMTERMMSSNAVVPTTSGFDMKV